MQRNLFCFGLGYSALALARRLRREGWNVSGTTRSEENADKLRRDGFTVFIFDGKECSDEMRRALAAAPFILVSAPPDTGGDPALAGAADSLRELAPRLAWLGYLSTAGVYGDHAGGWVDETTAPAPTSARAARRLAAEIAWQYFAAETGAPIHIFRLPGIYGPGRNVLEALRAGTARRFDKPGQVFSRIHVDDLAAALAASIAQPASGDIYNICDDEPAAQADIVAYGAELLGMPTPPLEGFANVEADLSEMARSFYRDSKRVRNEKAKRELGIVLAYPSYREGLRSLLSTN